jgi:hypothetical protein
MKTYEEIKEEARQTLDGKENRYVRRYLKLLKLLRSIFNEMTLWIISFIPWVIVPSIIHFIGLISFTPIDGLFYLVAHIIYWRFKGSKDMQELIDGNRPEIEMMIQAVEEIINESK